MLVRAVDLGVDWLFAQQLGGGPPAEESRRRTRIRMYRCPLSVGVKENGDCYAFFGFLSNTSS